jgi:hypothetical protein
LRGCTRKTPFDTKTAFRSENALLEHFWEEQIGASDEAQNLPFAGALGQKASYL